MHRLGEILAHDGIAVLAVIFALGAAVLSLANALSQEAVSAIEQHAREDDLHLNVLHTRFDYAYVLQALLAAMIVVAALLGLASDPRAAQDLPGVPVRDPARRFHLPLLHLGAP